MPRILLLGAAVVLVLVAIGGPARANSAPALTMVGNHSRCSLSSHKTFRMKLSGWKPHSTVQLKIYYGDGANYPFALKNQGRVQVNSNGQHTGPPWQCWPNKIYDVPDKKTWYIVFAFQIGSKPLKFDTSVFRVVR